MHMNATYHEHFIDRVLFDDRFIVEMRVGEQELMHGNNILKAALRFA
jgi:hypothetical protein